MSVQSRIPLTVSGAERLRSELEKLKSIERPAVIAAIAEARAHGDLKENAEYHAAREKQSFLEGRIRELEAKLANCQIIDVTQHTNEGRVIFGATVTLADANDDTQICYRIVGVDEADIKENTISVTSPIARAIIGKEEGDMVEVSTPQGMKSFEILKVEYI